MTNELLHQLESIFKTDAGAWQRSADNLRRAGVGLDTARECAGRASALREAANEVSKLREKTEPCVPAKTVERWARELLLVADDRLCVEFVVFEMCSEIESSVPLRDALTEILLNRKQEKSDECLGGKPKE